MLNLPKSTEFNKRIPKQKFYENLKITPLLKKLFVDEIKIIYWRNKLASTTLNVEEGKYVKEIEVFEIRLNQQSIDEKILVQIDQIIPYHILYVLEYKNKYQLVMSYKEVINKNTFKILKYFYSEWTDLNALDIKINGLNLDVIYESCIRQISKEEISNYSQKTLKESIEINLKKQNIQKQISSLQVKLRREKQLNRQMEINKKIKELRKEEEEL